MQMCTHFYNPLLSHYIGSAIIFLIVYHARMVFKTMIYGDV